MALAAAGVATGIPGFINVNVGRYVKAGGAIAIFVVVYFFNPAKLVTQDQDSGWVEQDVQFSANNEGSIYRVKIDGKGHANVSGEKIDVLVSEMLVKYPERYKDIEIESVIALRIALFCVVGDKYKEAAVSNRYLIGRKLPAGESIVLKDISLSIKKPEGGVVLSACGLGLLVDIGGGRDVSTGYVGASSAPYTFK